jgi:GAF domain-containing protein
MSSVKKVAKNAAPSPAPCRQSTAGHRKNKTMPKHRTKEFHLDAVSVRESEMLVATADASDELLDRAVSETLHLLRERLAMDVVFVSEFVEGRRVTRPVDAPESGAPADHANLLEEAWGQRVLDARLSPSPKAITPQAGYDAATATPLDAPAFLSAPVVLSSGETYGTLCCVSRANSPMTRERDLRNLQSVAQLIATRIEKSPTAAHDAHIPTEPAPLTLVSKW